MLKCQRLVVTGMPSQPMVHRKQNAYFYDVFAAHVGHQRRLKICFKFVLSGNLPVDSKPNKSQESHEKDCI